MNLFELVEAEQAVQQGTQASTYQFSCCSKYRECSDARRCLRGDSPSCEYRARLERGRIFYGRNAEWYSADEHERYRRMYAPLSEAAKLLLLEITGGYCIRNKLVQRCPALNELISSGLFEENNEPFYFINPLLVKKDLIPLYEWGPIRTASGKCGQYETAKDALAAFIRNGAEGYSLEPLKKRYAVVSMTGRFPGYYAIGL